MGIMAERRGGEYHLIITPMKIIELKEYYGIDDELVESSIPSAVSRSPETPESPEPISNQQDLAPVEQDFKEIFGE